MAKILTISDHPLLIGEILKRARVRENRRFARRHRAARIVALIEVGVYLAAAALTLGLIFGGIR
jgi:hypothetical protein